MTIDQYRNMPQLRHSNAIGRNRWALAAITLELFLAVGAIGGGIALMVGPNGEIIPLPVSALAGSNFVNYFIPGAILFTILGMGPLGVALLASRRHSTAPMLAFISGAALLIWLFVEIAIVGYTNQPPLQALYIGLGVVLTLTGAGWIWDVRSHSARSRR